MNKVIMTGRLTKPPEYKTTTSGTPVCQFSIAVDRRFKNKAGETVADFFTVITWKTLADICNRCLDKGKKVAVVGELQTRSYEKDGQKRFLTEIIADEVEFLSPKEERQVPAGMTAGKTDKDGFTDIKDDDLPF